MSNVYAEYAETMRRELGLRPSTAAVCPRVVAGKRCQVGWSLDRCVCQRLEPTVFDHAYIWLEGGRWERRYVLTAEPYELTDEKLARYRDAVAPWGLVVTVHPHNYWFTGTTLLICRRGEWSHV